MLDRKLLEFELCALSEDSHAIIAGVDEAGRGPLAGPVVVAAVVLKHPETFQLPVNDSKQLTEKTREELAEMLRNSDEIEYSIVLRTAEEIDRMNILEATHSAMRESVLRLPRRPTLAFVDGLKVKQFSIPAQFLVKGDARSASIAAASILAKTYRDALMREAEKDYPGYGFAIHKGYGTAAHLEALKRLGPCPLHRRTFGPVRRILEPVTAPIQLTLF